MAHPVLDSCLALHRDGRLTEAEAGYRQCLREGLDEASFPLSVLLLQQRRYAEAVDVLAPLAEAGPDDVPVVINLSIALRHSGQPDAALRFARSAAAAAPGNVGACNALGLAALQAGHVEEALQAFESGLRQAPGHVALVLHRGKCLRRLGRTREALAVLEQVVVQAPHVVEAWRTLASLQATSGLTEAALESSTRALALAPHDGDVALEHAVALLRSGHADTAALRLRMLLDAGRTDAGTWGWLGRSYLRLRDFEAARAAFERANAIDPDDSVAAHYLAALDGVLPGDMESDYVRSLFDDFADRFEDTLVDRLAYATPRALARFLRAEGMDDAARVLDLGCGTGLMGVELARSGRHMDGVDLSPRMLEYARSKGIYRELHVAELLEFLRGTVGQWDLVVAADVFVYVADLQPIFAAVRERLASGGGFAFSVECSSTERTELLPETGRYRHSPRRVADALIAAGFEGIRREAVVLRMESGNPVSGELLLARRT